MAALHHMLQNSIQWVSSLFQTYLNGSIYLKGKICFTVNELHSCVLCHCLCLRKCLLVCMSADRRNIAEEGPDAVCHLWTSCRSINCRRRGGWWLGGQLSWQGGDHPVTCQSPKPRGASERTVKLFLEKDKNLAELRAEGKRGPETDMLKPIL